MEQRLSDSKPRLISHRGNLTGPDSKNENKFSYIETALSYGFDVELDVWVENNRAYLGHDKPTYSLSKKMISEIGPNGWFHCKNLEALEYFHSNFRSYNYFWHQSDDYSMTSQGYPWTINGNDYSLKTVIVDLEPGALDRNPGCYAICTDYLI